MSIHLSPPGLIVTSDGFQPIDHGLSIFAGGKCFHVFEMLIEAAEPSITTGSPASFWNVFTLFSDREPINLRLWRFPSTIEEV